MSQVVVWLAAAGMVALILLTASGFVLGNYITAVLGIQLILVFSIAKLWRNDGDYHTK